jgi:hypothetical protein
MSYEIGGSHRMSLRNFTTDQAQAFRAVGTAIRILWERLSDIMPVAACYLRCAT